MRSTARVNTAQEQLNWVLKRVGPLPIDEVAVREAHGLTLATDVKSPLSLPLWDNSAMDGYAVRAADVADAAPDSPMTLRIVGEVLAGGASDPSLDRGDAVRIMTGAPVPTAADTVIPVELTRGDKGDGSWATDSVVVQAAVAVGANVRRRGEDISEGSVLATAGDLLGAARLAALAAAGVERVLVRKVPRVAVVVTGSELRGSEEPLKRGQIPESNSVLIAGLLRECGVQAVEVHHSDDKVASLAHLLRELGGSFDVVMTTGGIGPGTHDVVRIALEAEPAVRAARVAVRPAKLQCAGKLSGGAFVFALPGNPVSAAVSFELFVRPALLAMQGRSEVHRIPVPAVAEADWRGAEGRLQVLPVVVRPVVESGGAPMLSCAPAVNPRGVSHAVGGHGAANGYALVEADRGDVVAGDTVPVILVAP
ncbi:molybdopterin molybdotransferase MoeA [Leucobacter coleopterorum]|uniref:Molybdopterin molybdenumtransferase n=1 Tax=Leucobacter coleopterorum TaxID=2714933 RepID=A0ABX6K0T9_9MICO|nr:gephyrin-like molybdotransferase Glp [Leucobacter coleopterorum]QIM18862.1 molybdopterin molybdotransferase MoeA [Leucobacter coleopterorum]